MARLLFIGMWNFADDLGRLPMSPKTIKAQVFPSDDITSDDIRRMLDELSSNKLLLVYEVDGREYLQITGWQHQKIDRPQPGKCPRPTNGFKPIEKPSLDEHSTNDRRVIDDGKERKGREWNGEDSEAIASGAEAPRKRVGSRFDEFWAAYPRRDGPNPRKPAEQRFASLVKSGLDPGMMIEAAQKLAADEMARGNVGTRFIPQALTWLNQQRWADHSAVVELQQQQAAANLASKIHVKTDTPQWRAWAAYLGTPPPLDRNFGWHFDSEWPPDHMQAAG